MNDAQLQAFRDMAAAMQTEPTDWQWIGPHMSQRMFGITQKRAEEYAARHGGRAEPMPPVLGTFNRALATEAAARVKAKEAK